MKAATYDNYGPADVLNVADVARPSVGEHDVLVEVRASEVTQGDRRLRSADFPGATWIVGRLLFGVIRPRHRVPGSMFAGRVVEVGPGVTAFEVGQDVFGGVMHGAYAEYLCVPEQGAIARMPDGWSYEQAAVLSYGPGTASVFLEDLAEVQPGERVLVAGAAGGVGRYAVQFAKYLGAHVTALCGASDADYVRELGADAVLDYRTQGPADAGQPFDVIFDTSGTLSFGETRRALGTSGRFLSLEVSLGLLIAMLLTSFRKGQKAIFGVAEPGGDDLERLSSLAEKGAVRPIVDSRFALDDIREAHLRVERDRPRGNVVVTVSTGASNLRAVPGRESGITASLGAA